MEKATSRHVLLTGATGTIGPCVARTMLEAGYKVRIFAIDPAQPGALPDKVDVIVGDILDPAAIRSAIRGAGFVIHMAALLHRNNLPRGMQAKYEQVNVGGTAIVVRAALEEGVERLVFFSSIAVYGPSGGQLLTEESPVHPESFYAQTKLRAEKIVLDAKRPDGNPLGTVLRLAAVYGPLVKGNYRRLVHSLARRRFLPIGPGTNRRTLVHDKDVAKAALLAARHPAAAGRTYNVTDGGYPSMDEIIRVICQSLGKKTPHWRLPVRPIWCMAGMMEAVARLAGLREPIGREAIDKYTEDLAVSGARLQTELGFAPDYNLKRGWAETILELRRLGTL